MSLRKYDDGDGKFRYMDLASTCPDGHVVTTRWIPGQKFHTAASRPPSMDQLAHAEHHHRRVMVYLRENGLNRLAPLPAIGEADYVGLMVQEGMA